MKKKTLLLIICALVLVAVVVAAVLLLRNTGAGRTAQRPVKIATTLDFNQWFGQGKKLSKRSGETVYFTLTGDLKVKTQGVIAGGNHIIFDLNGHSLTGEDARVFEISAGSLSLKNGKVSGNGAPKDGGVVLLSGEGCQLEASGVTFSNTDDSTIPARLLGGVIYAYTPSGSAAPSRVTLKEGTTVNGSASGLRRAGGAIALSGSQLYIYDATVRGGKAGTAGNIYADGNSQVYLLGGTVEGGTALKSTDIDGFGGNFYIQGLTGLYVREGKILGGSAEVSGGNIYLSNSAGEEAGLHLLSGTVEGGTAKTDGGNIYAMDTFSAVRIYGGEISGGNALQGGNIFLKGAPFEMRNGTLTGVADNSELLFGSNIYGDNASLKLYGGQICYGVAAEFGGNIYVTDSQVDIYGGQIIGGAVNIADVTRGGGNLYAGRDSRVRIYGGEISGGISNCLQDQENSAAGGNVMVAGTTRMEMFGGTIQDGMVYGSITRGGSVYVYGQSKRSDVTFHFYGGLIENGLLDNKMRGMCIGSYSETKGDDGHAVTRIFGGQFRYTGPQEDNNKVYTIHGNKDGDMYLFDDSNYEGLYSRTLVGPCADASHFTQTGEVAATCVTQGCIQYTCQSCGVWYVITADPTGHKDTTEETELGTKHTCESCGSWYEDAAALD